MLKTLTGITVAATLAVAGMTVAPQKAEAHCYGCAVGAGVIGGLAAGAIIGSAIAGPHYYGYGPGYYYAPAPAYYYGPHCWWRRHWTPYGWRAVRVCR
jgi:hypothetical protein